MAPSTPTEPASLVRQPLREHAPMAMHDVAVRAVERLTPRRLRITFHGPSLAGFVDDGADQRVKLLLPRPGQRVPVVQSSGDWFTGWLDQPISTRPIIRTYTVRRLRPADAELDIEFVLHDQPGPAASWAAGVRTGDRVAVYGACAEYEPPPDTEWQLLLGDESALPAIAAILERSSLPANVFVEVADRREHIELAAAHVTWLHRSEGATLLDAVRRAAFSNGRLYVWLAGECLAVKAIRRHLLHVRGVPRASTTFMPYWRADGPIDP
jgi:NADPH-dependent ferric siderophore reductase